MSERTSLSMHADRCETDVLRVPIPLSPTAALFMSKEGGAKVVLRVGVLDLVGGTNEENYNFTYVFVWRSVQGVVVRGGAVWYRLVIFANASNTASRQARQRCRTVNTSNAKSRRSLPETSRLHKPI